MALYPVKSAERVLKILELFQNQQRSLSATEVARQLHWPSPSTLAILKTLAGAGYFIFDNTSKTYFPSPRLANLSNWVHSSFFEGSPVINLAHELSSQTDAGVIVSILNDLHVQYLLVIPGKDNARYGATERGLRLVVDSCAGLTFLSSMSEDAVDRVCRRINIQYKSRGERIEPKSITRLTRTFSRQGYGILAGKPDSNIMSLSMALPTAPSGRTFAITIAGARETITANYDELLERMTITIANGLSDPPRAIQTR